MEISVLYIFYQFLLIYTHIILNNLHLFILLHYEDLCICLFLFSHISMIVLLHNSLLPLMPIIILSYTIYVFVNISFWVVFVRLRN